MTFAKIDEVSEGTLLVADGGFYGCLREGQTLTVKKDDSTTPPCLYVKCLAGRHYLDGQLDDGDEYVGFTLA